MNEPRAYAFSDARRLTGVGRGHLARWIAAGVIVPELGGGGVSGAHHKFSFRNLFEIAIGVELQRFRVHQDFIGYVLRKVRALENSASLRDKDLAFRMMSRELERKVRRANPDANSDTISAVAGELTTLLLAEADNWWQFEDPDTRQSSAFLVLQLTTAPVVVEHCFVEFATTLAKFDNRMFPESIKGSVLPTTIVIDVAQVLGALEAATGDRL